VAKQLRRRIKRRYYCTGKKSDKEAYNAATAAAHCNCSIIISCGDTFRKFVVNSKKFKLISAPPGESQIDFST